MIQGYFGNYDVHPWPMIVAGVTIPSLSIIGIVHFLIDTGSNNTNLSPKDAARFGVDASALVQADPVTGVGGKMAAVVAEATITLEHLTFPTRIYVFVPSRRQRRTLLGIPSVLGRDILSHFTLLVEQRTRQVLLLQEGEALTGL